MTPKPELLPAPPSTAIVIVTNSGAPALERCLKALSGAPAIFVVDNGSGASAGMEDAFPTVRFIRLPRNFGLTKALNIGVRAIDEAEFVLLLSPEVEITADAVKRLADALEQDPKIGAVSPLLTLPGGRAWEQVSDLPTPSTPHPVARPGKPGQLAASVAGKAILLRLFFLRALRQIDERYGDYGSAPELCRQLQSGHKEILIHPEVTAIIHPEDPAPGAARDSDYAVGTAGFLFKYFGFGAGLLYVLKRIFGALLWFRFARLMLLLNYKKIDGN